MPTAADDACDYRLGAYPRLQEKALSRRTSGCRIGMIFGLLLMSGSPTLAQSAPPPARARAIYLHPRRRARTSTCWRRRTTSASGSGSSCCSLETPHEWRPGTTRSPAISEPIATALCLSTLSRSGQGTCSPEAGWNSTPAATVSLQSKLKGTSNNGVFYWRRRPIAS
jgi:hypothetical protein